MNVARMLAVVIVIAAVAACGGPRPALEDAAAVAQVRSHIAVLPLRNDTNDVNGPGTVQAAMARALRSRFYVVRDVAATDRILMDRFGITLGGQLETLPVAELGEALNTEAVLYGTLMDFNETTTGAYTVRKVRAKFRLVSTATGGVLWERGLGVRSEMSMSGAGGLAGTALGRLSDPRDAEAPWVTIEHVRAGDTYQESLAIGLGTKLLTKALRIHLERESSELARRIIDTLRWTPGR
jgi:hypothetical protein